MDFLDLKYTHVLTYTRIMAHESIRTLLETFYDTGNFLKTHQHNDETRLNYIGKILNGPKNIYIEVTIVKVFEVSITDYVNELKC